MSVAIVCMVNQTALKIAEANSSSNDTSTKIETDQQCGLMQAGASNETKSGSFQVHFSLARSCENMSYDKREQQTCRSACASAQSDQHLYC